MYWVRYQFKNILFQQLEAMTWISQKVVAAAVLAPSQDSVYLEAVAARG